jgi:hypothetical protein
MVPPDEQSALAAAKKVQVLNGPALEKRVREEVGDPMLAIFALLAKNIEPQADDAAIARRVQGIVLAYLIRGTL